MATKAKGPSFAGPLSGWTAARLTPTAQAVVDTPAPAPTPAAPTDLSKYQLNASQLGLAELGRQPIQKPQTGLESLLAAIFPNAADEGADLNTILGNLGVQGASSAPAYAAPAYAGAAVPTIPGAPGFLAGAIQGLNAAGQPVGPLTAAPSLTALPGIAAISAEQRMQEAQMQQAVELKAAQNYELRRQQQEAVDAAARLKRAQGSVIGSQVSGWSPLTSSQRFLQGYRPPGAPAYKPYTPPTY